MFRTCSCMLKSCSEHIHACSSHVQNTFMHAQDMFRTCSGHKFNNNRINKNNKDFEVFFLKMNFFFFKFFWLILIFWKFFILFLNFFEFFFLRWIFYYIFLKKLVYNPYPKDSKPLRKALHCCRSKKETFCSFECVSARQGNGLEIQSPKHYSGPKCPQEVSKNGSGKKITQLWYALNPLLPSATYMARLDQILIAI